MRQRAVALYFIDKLALRAGNEKDEDQADTVGCCSLRVEHITLHEEHEGEAYLAMSIVVSGWLLDFSYVVIRAVSFLRHAVDTPSLCRYYNLYGFAKVFI